MKNLLRLSVISISMALLLSACRFDENSIISGFTDTNTSATNTPMSVGQAILSAEANGTIPKLNHDDTIAGPDTDGNGIRDDIDAYITTLPYTDVQKKAIQQDARATIAALTVDKTDKTALEAVSSQIDRGVGCVYYQFPQETTLPSELITDNEKMIVNTKNRFIEYEKYNSALSGSVIDMQEGDTCDK